MGVGLAARSAARGRQVLKGFGADGEQGRGGGEQRVKIVAIHTDMLPAPADSTAAKHVCGVLLPPTRGQPWGMRSSPGVPAELP